jgi:Uma2 family endonuclease
MGRIADLHFVSPEAYLEWENRQAEKHEYLGGEVYAMTGASQAHVVVNGNLFAALAQHLRGSACRAYLPDMKLRIATVDGYFYPDIKVSCEERDFEAPYAIEHPVLIGEILSPSTADYDRGTKLSAYLRIPSLREVLFVDPESRAIHVYRRNADDTWLLMDLSGASVIRLESLDFEVAAARLFEGL